MIFDHRYLRIIFEYAGVPYEEINDDLRDYFWNKTEQQPTPVLAPPAVVYNDVAVAQTGVAAEYLATKFDLLPPGSPESAAKARQIVATVHEYIAEGRLSFHPVKNTMSYHDQVEEAKPYIAAFCKDRLPRYFGHFERLLKSNDGDFFVGPTLSYVDLQVLVMLQVTRFQFPDTWNDLPDVPLLKAFLDRMESLPKIKAYLDSDRKKPFAGDSLM